MTRTCRWLAPVAALMIGDAASAQPAPAAASPVRLACPANGYAKPYFGAFGDNDGILRGYEIASPCIAKEVIAAADAIGMGRGNPLGVKSVSTIRFGATGKIAGDSGAPVASSDIDIAISYAVPATRITVRGLDGAQHGRVIADGNVWDEAAPGVSTKRAAASALGARAPLMRLTPFGAMLAIIEAEGHATVTNQNGHIVLSAVSPYDKYPIKVTLDAKNLPISAELRDGAKIYNSTFEGYSDKWESPYLVIFPEHIVWTLNGKPYADLKVTRFHSNPYVVFPLPAESRK